MMKLLQFELRKIWFKRSFQILSCVLFILNLFMLWYSNIPNENEPSFSSYKALSSDLVEMNEVQKLDYVSELKERIDGISVARDVMNFLASGDELSKQIAAQLQNENKESFEKYKEYYQNGDYLVYTDSLDKESTFLSEIYNEIKTVSGYDEYLDSIQENKETLSGISIFAPANVNSFSIHNTTKSAEDHQMLSSENVIYFPSKGFILADGNIITELFMILSIFLFVGSLITEEKEKGLFYITRSTKRGIAMSIGAKLLALLIHSITISAMLYGSNLVFASATVGLGNLDRAIQSIPIFMESSLSINLWEYILLGILIKSFVLFIFGAAITLISILAQKNFVPLICSVGIIGINLLMFTIIPASSKLAPFKYMSIFGLIKPELLFGGYLNFNIANQPISRLVLSVWVVVALCIVSILLCVLCFCKKRNFNLNKTQVTAILPFKPHANLFLHETHKIMIMGKAVLIILLFVALIVGRDLGRTYSPSIEEQYYKDIMGKLEGGITEEKEALIASEQKRYDEAFAQIEKINTMIASGKIDEMTGDNMKTKWLGVLSFFPEFQRVQNEYEHIKENDGVFIYDTGYMYLFGKMDNSFLIDFLLLSLCIVFAFGNVIAMEHEKNSWYLLSATTKGKCAIIRQKTVCCIICIAVLVIMPWIFRITAISAVYPLDLWSQSVRNIPMYFNLGISVSIWLFTAITITCQVIAVLFVCAIVLFISWWRKNYLQTTFISLILLVIPTALALMGFGFAKWVSFYLLYGLASFL